MYIMKHLISFNESFRVESIRSDVEQMFYSEVDDESFKIYRGLYLFLYLVTSLGIYDGWMWSSSELWRY